MVRHKTISKHKTEGKEEVKKEMAASNIPCLALVALVIAGILISGNHVSAQTCGVSISDLIGQCSKYVQKPGPQTDPSPECCGVIKNVDVPCVCNLVTKEIEALVSMEKVIHVARFCGVTVKSGQKCGSYTVPKA